MKSSIRYKHRQRIALWFLSLLIWQPAFAFFSDEAIEVLRKENGKFPKMEFAKKEGYLASLRPISDQGVKFGDEFYRGARVTAPDWIVGTVVWMIASEKIGPLPKNKHPWRIIPVSKNKEPRQFSTVFSDPENGRYTTYKKIYPNREKFAQISLPKNEIIPGQEYLVLYGREDGLLPKTEFAFTCYSLTGEIKCGALPTAMPDAGPNRNYRTNFESSYKPADEIVAETLAVFNEQGREASRKFLDKELNEMLSKGGMFVQLYQALWKDAQTGSGRTDKEWAAFGFEYIVNKAWEYQAFDFSANSASNAVLTLLRVHRIAAANRAFVPFRYKMKRQGLSQNITDYPLESTPMETFPEIKLYHLPATPPKRISMIHPMGNANSKTTQKFSSNTVNALENLSALHLIHGRWKSAIEWRLAAANLATKLDDFKKGVEINESYLTNMNGATSSLIALGFHDEALKIALSLRGENYLNASGYGWRAHQISDINVLECRHALGTLRKSKDLEWIDSRVEKLRANKYVQTDDVQKAELVQVKVYLSIGDSDLNRQALTHLEKLASTEEYLPARLFRIELNLKENSLDGLEEELISLLKQYRESGRKIDEWKLYSLYAELLLKEGRLEESLAMQREALRLLKAFDLFPFEPLEKMKLARILLASGLEKEAAREAALAKSIVANTKRFSGPHLDRVIGSLESFTLESPAIAKPDEKPSSFGVVLQPTQSLIVPIEGKPGEAKFTLMNLSNQPMEGTLALSGTETSLTYLEDEASVQALIGISGKSKLSQLKIDPGTYLLLSIKLAPDSYWDGKVQIEWKAAKKSAKASVTFEKKEFGVSSAVIDAGNYQLNEFYGVPIHHHFHKTGNDPDLDFRVKTSMAARVEGYDTDDKLLFVDANGNGSFLDPGDLINLDEDASGYPDLPLQKDEALFRLQVYPKGAPTEEGIEVSIEGKDGKNWIVMSIDHLSFPKSKKN